MTTAKWTPGPPAAPGDYWVTVAPACVEHWLVYGDDAGRLWAKPEEFGEQFDGILVDELVCHAHIGIDRPQPWRAEP